MLKLTVAVNDLIDAIRSELRHHQTNYQEELQITKNIVDRIMGVKSQANERIESLTNEVLRASSVGSEFFFYSTVVGDIVVRYYDYIDDSSGYSCSMWFVGPKKKIILQGTSTCIQRIKQSTQSASGNSSKTYKQ